MSVVNNSISGPVINATLSLYADIIFDGFFLDALFHATEDLTFISSSGKKITLNELQSLDSFMFENKEFSVRFDDESENMIQQIFEQSIKTQSQMIDSGFN